MCLNSLLPICGKNKNVMETLGRFMQDEEREYRATQIDASKNVATRHYFKRLRTDYHNNRRNTNILDEKKSSDAKILKITKIKRCYFSIIV